MKKLIHSISPEDNVIHIIMYLHPIIYDNAPVLSSVQFDEKTRRYTTDTNPARRITGPLSDKGESLEPPIQEEWDHFVDDCRFLIKELGFTIISESTSETSKKSEYFIVFGLNGTPCGTIVYDLRISDHPLDAKFPEDAKDRAFEYLKMENVLDGTASKAGIDFQVEKVTVGIVSEDSWNSAFNRLYEKLKRMRDKIRKRLNSRSSNDE